MGPGGGGGEQYIAKMGLLSPLGLFFSNCNSCIGGCGSFETLVDPFPRPWGAPRPRPLHLCDHFSSPARDGDKVDFACASGGEGPVLQSLSALGLNASPSTNRAMHDFVTKLALLSKM